MPPRITLAIASLLVAVTHVCATVLTGSLGSHDPSRIINCNGRYYVYSTGGGMKYSDDRVNWTTGTSPFPNGVPTSVKNLLPSNQGIWAPDVIYRNSKYYLYYSVAAADGASSGGTAIGLLTSPTLDPNGSGYKWTDVGVAIFDNMSDKRSCIDPCPFVDASNNFWLSYGSGYGNGVSYSDPTIFVVALNSTTGLVSNSTLHGIENGHIEGSYVYYHSGYYYCFWNSGGCCDGASSTYTIHVARSTSVTGPYVDKSGTAGGEETFLASTVTKNSVDGAEHGPGHMGILYEDGIYRCSYHYYPDSGGSVLGEETLIWGSDGWPVAGTDLAPGKYKFNTKYTSSLYMGIQGANGALGTPIDEEAYTGSTYQQWNVDFASDGYYTILSAGNGKSVDLYQSDPDDGSLIDEWTASGSDNQHWLIEQTSDGSTYRIVSKSSGSVIDCPGGKHTSGTNLDEWEWNQGTNQLWILSAP